MERRQVQRPAAHVEGMLVRERRGRSGQEDVAPDFGCATSVGWQRSVHVLARAAFAAFLTWLAVDGIAVRVFAVVAVLFVLAVDIEDGLDRVVADEVVTREVVV